MSGRDHSVECPYCHVWHGGLHNTPCNCETGESVVLRADDKGPIVFTETALAAQDGKKVPLTLEIGGPVVGEASLEYDPGEKALKAKFRVADPKAAELLRENLPNIFGQES